MPRTRYYTATSLDGFIADPDNSLDWLLSRKTDEGGPAGYEEFIRNVGGMAMGATTYEWILNHEGPGGWVYAMPCWVFTHREHALFDGADVRFTQDDVGVVHQRMTEAAGGKDLWLVGGGDLVGQFADRGLLDELVVSIAPVTLGGGAPLLPRRIELTLNEVGRNGEFAVARFDVVKG